MEGLDSEGLGGEGLEKEGVRDNSLYKPNLRFTMPPAVALLNY